MSVLTLRVKDSTHQQLRLLAAIDGHAMAAIVERLVNEEYAQVAPARGLPAITTAPAPAGENAGDVDADRAGG